MKNIKKVKDRIVYYLGIKNMKGDKTICSLEKDLANLIYEDLIMEGEQGNYKLTYYYNKEDLKAIIEWYKNEFKTDYKELIKINIELEKFTVKHNAHFRDFASEVFYYICESFANEVIYQFFDSNFDNYYDEDDEDDEYYDPNERID